MGSSQSCNTELEGPSLPCKQRSWPSFRKRCFFTKQLPHQALGPSIIHRDIWMFSHTLHTQCLHTRCRCCTDVTPNGDVNDLRHSRRSQRFGANGAKSIDAKFTFGLGDKATRWARSAGRHYSYFNARSSSVLLLVDGTSVSVAYGT